MSDAEVTTLSRLFLRSCRTYKKPDRMVFKRAGIWRRSPRTRSKRPSGACPSVSGSSA